MLNDMIESVKIFPNVTLVTINNVNAVKREHIFRKLSESGINLDMISQSPCFGGDITLSFSLPDADLAKTLEAVAAFKTEYDKIELQIWSNNLIISFFSAEMINSPGVAASVFEAFSAKEINIVLVTTSDISISCLIAKSDEVKAMKMLQKHNLI
jgi:aspartate kinase